MASPEEPSGGNGRSPAPPLHPYGAPPPMGHHHAPGHAYPPTHGSMIGHPPPGMEGHSPGGLRAGVPPPATSGGPPPPPHHHHHPPPPHQPYPYMYPPPPSSPAGYPPPYGPPPAYYGYHQPYYSYPPPQGYYGYPTQATRQPSSARKKTPGRKPGPTVTEVKTTQLNPKVAMDVEQQRILAAADPSEVKPMRSDFHFFCEDRRKDIKEAALKELGPDIGGDLYLLMSNMNCRFLKAWENAEPKTREYYFGKEEEDRKRFMEEDEIASRHCATLTARSKSPDELQPTAPDEQDFNKKRNSPSQMDESPPKRNRTETASVIEPAGIEEDKTLEVAVKQEANEE